MSTPSSMSTPTCNDTKLYVFETTLPNGSVTTGTAGLPYNEMVKYREFLQCKPLIVFAPTGTPLIQVVLPISRKHN